MKKTAGLVALSFSLAAVGCALVPQTAVKSLSPNPALSGPVTIHVDGIPADRNTQSLSSAAVMLEVKVFKGNGYTPTCMTTTHDASGNPEVQLSPTTGALLVATSSVTSGQTTLTLAGMPAGYNVIQVNAYTSKTTKMSYAADGADQPIAKTYLIGQSEGYINALAGIPTSVSLPIYRVIPYGSQIADGTAYAGNANATASVTASNISARSNNLTYVRLANFNPIVDAATATVRVAIVSTTAFASSLASGNVAVSLGGFWNAGGLSSTWGISATQSPPAWTFADPATRKVIYTDIDVSGASGSACAASLANVFDAATSSVGMFSIVLPAAYLPTGYQMTFTELASGSTLAGSGGL